MNPDPEFIAQGLAQLKHDERQREIAKARSRAAQPRRKDNRRARPTGKR